MTFVWLLAGVGAVWVLKTAAMGYETRKAEQRDAAYEASQRRRLGLEPEWGERWGSLDG